LSDLRTSASDGYGLRHARGNDAARAHFSRATRGLLAYRADMLGAIDDALAEEPDLPAAHALRGLALLMASRRETLEAANICLRDAHAARAETTDEITLIRALQAGLCAGLTAAADVLDARLLVRPQSALLVKLSTGLRFVGGDAAGMRATTAIVLPAWDAGAPGYSHMLGCHAFGLEEAGCFAEAETAGRQAVALDPDDPWAIHAVAHVLEMINRPSDGLAWTEGLRPHWQNGNPFGRHVAWHQALFHLESHGTDAVLRVYDQEIRPDRSEDNRDLANAVSLLWRLRQMGIDVGDRWVELAEIAARRRDETHLVFATLHRLLALIAVGDRDSAQATMRALAAAAQTGSAEQSWVAAAVGLPLARALLELQLDLLDAGAPSSLPLCRIAASMEPMGGSHAQRDVFMRSLISACAARGDQAMLTRLLDLRRQLKRDDAFVRLVTG
jgi:hypothetical protein